MLLWTFTLFYECKMVGSPKHSEGSSVYSPGEGQRSRLQFRPLQEVSCHLAPCLCGTAEPLLGNWVLNSDPGIDVNFLGYFLGFLEPPGLWPMKGNPKRTEQWPTGIRPWSWSRKHDTLYCRILDDIPILLRGHQLGCGSNLITLYHRPRPPGWRWAHSGNEPWIR